MKINLRKSFVSLMALAVFAGAWALDLPIKSINGKDYYYYAVKRGDSLIAVANALGVTRDDIIKYNPAAADGLRQGTTLYLPVSEYKNIASPAQNDAGAQHSEPFPYKVKRGETLFGISHRFGVKPDDIIALNPATRNGLKAGQTIMIPAGAAVETEAVTPVATPEPVGAEHQPEEIPSVGIDDSVRSLTPVVMEPTEIIPTTDVRPSIALFLPLSLNGNAQERAAKTSTEFVKGFMLGLNSMRDTSLPVDIHIFDTAGKCDTIPSLLARPECQDLSLIVTAESQAAVTATYQAMGDRNTFLLNLLAVSDTTYLLDSRVMQASVPHSIMYAKATEALMMTFDGYTPVYLISKGGKSEKLPFTEYLRGEYLAQGIEPIEISFEGMLSSQDLEQLDPTGSYVFIPGSGSLTEFNKFARALLAFRETLPDPGQVGVFGYPDWTAFRSDAADLLHQLCAIIYSRFYEDNTDDDVRRFATLFEAEYGAPMLEQVPSQALLGYDTARYILSNIKAGNGNFNPEWDTLYRGLQSTFMFIDAEGALEVDGCANQAVYIIKFLPGNEVRVQVI
ncbi:MAG: LysM peptidoglycan-binding domain-containing protein [Muribaculaceae bacterium]